MTLADAFHLLATTGCRLSADPAGGITLTVPDGAVVPADVLDTIRAHRDQLGAALAEPAAPANDLRDYLAGKGITGSSADFVERAAETFNVRHDRITVERDGPEPEVVFFEPGIPLRTLADTDWSAPGGGIYTIPGGTVGLAIPQVWAIDDPFERRGIEAILESIRRRKLPRHIPVWLDGKPRVIEITLIDFENVTATPGMNLMPWRPETPRSATS